MKKLIPFILCILLSGCMQNYVKVLPEDIETIHYTFFDNKTYEPNLENTLQDSMVETTIKEGTLYPANKKEADLIVRGSIIHYTEEELGLDGEEIPTSMKLEMTAAIELYRQGEYAPFAQYKELIADGYYSTDLRKEMMRTKKEAIKDACDNMARKALDKVLYGKKKKRLQKTKNAK